MTVSKPIILTFVGCYFPGYKFGGQVRTTTNMVDHLGDEFDFRIVTMDRDFLDTEPYPDVEADAWNQVGKAQVFYCAPSHRSLFFLRRLLSKTAYDVLYLHGFFDPVFTIKLLLLRCMKMIPKRPVVLAPHGEFSRGAVNIKAWKKKPYLVCAKVLGLYRNLVWHASATYEAADIKTIMGNTASNIVVAINLSPLSDKSPEPQWPDKSTECLRVAFLSRVSPKKNLDYALNVLKNVRVRVCYDIYGTLEDRSYWASCRKIINAMPGNVAVEYKGEVPHDKVCDILHGYDLFFFPTRGENYGYVIHEALTAGLPVLISDQTPWRNLPEKGVGWDLQLDDPSAFIRRIEEVAHMDVAAHKKLRNCAWEYGRQSQNDDALQANRCLFLNLKLKWMALSRPL